MWHENVDISITGNSTNPRASSTPSLAPTRRSASSWQEVLLRRLWWRHWPHSAPGQHGRRPCLLRHDRHHGPYALRRQFAGSSSVPAHVDMMGLIGMGNNPMVGATVACAVAVEEALKA